MWTLGQAKCAHTTAYVVPGVVQANVKLKKMYNFYTIIQLTALTPLRTCKSLVITVKKTSGMIKKCNDQEM